MFPQLAVGTRRLRDIGMSGWCQLLMLAPVGGLVVMAYFWAQPTVPPQPDETIPV